MRPATARDSRAQRELSCAPFSALGGRGLGGAFNLALGFLGGFRFGGGVGLQFRADQLGIHALHYRQHAFQRQFPDMNGVLYPCFQLGGGGQEEYVGRSHAVHGGHEGGGDAVADFVDIGQVFHDLHEAEDGSDDADGGRVSAGSLKNLGFRFTPLLQQRNFQFHNAAELV